MWARVARGPRSVDEVVMAPATRAVELCSRPSFIPVELNMAPFDDCGAVVIWIYLALGVD